MTEEEAKTKWCPFIRLTASGGSEWHTNRDPSLPSSPSDTQAYRCIASACMAWRVAQVGRVEEGNEYKTYKPVGYCGLAGAPQ